MAAKSSFFKDNGTTTQIQGSASASATAALASEQAAATSETNSAASAAAALVSQNAAATSAAAALVSENAAASSAASSSGSAADAVATAADRVQTGLDRTAASNSATAAASDATQVATDAAQVASDKTQTAADRVQTGQDATASAASATSATASQTAAATSATNAGTSETNSGTSATNAANSATAAANSATAAAASETAAASSETASAASQTSAASSASTATTQASNASSSATSASTSASSANTAKTAAETAKTDAETAETNASNSATAAANSATAGATSATNASNSASAASTSATSAASSTTNAAASAQTATTQATNASNSASAAATSAASANNSASAAATSATNAAASETSVASDAAAAAASETAAAASETAAANSASTASTQASNAATSASTASTQANAASQEAVAAGQARTNADAAAISAASSAASAVSTYDQFDDRYLGSKNTSGGNPTTDNDGNALLTGALMWDDTNSLMKVYNGSSWVAAYASSGGALVNTNNLSDVSSASSARGNLGLGTAATTAAADYATAAQGTKADAALPKAGGALTGAVTTNSTFDGRDVGTDGTKLDTIETNATADQTASELLTAVKTVDGSGSGLDADLLDGQQGSYYTGYTDTAVSNLVDSSPAALNTLNELAAALGDDANFSTTVTNSIATKLPLAGGALTGAVTTNSTFDGRDVATDGTKLDGIEASADVTDTANVVASLTAGTGISIAANGTIANTIAATTSASDLTSGTLADARFPATLPAISGANLTNLPAAGIANVVEDTSPQLGGDLETNGNNINFADNDVANFGAGSDLKIYHAGNHSYISDDGTGSLFIRASDMQLQDAGGNEFLKFDSANNKVYLGNSSYQPVLKYGSTDRLSVNNNGATVVGTVDATAFTGDGSGLTNLPTSSDATKMPLAGGTFTGNVQFGDDDQAIFGAGSDLTIKSDGANALIQGAGTTYFRGSTVIIGANGGSGGFETGIRVNEVSAETSQVELYYDNALRLETVSGGVEVTGTLAATAVTGDGSGLTGIAAGATGGGSDQIFYENGQAVTTNYTISNGKNAMSAGPITINNGVTVTVGTGETWTVV